MKLNKVKKIYVTCMKNFASGGPELLHQLVHELRKQHKDAAIYYYNYRGEKNPIHEKFRKYVDDFCTEIEDSPENLLILPEVKTDMLYNYEKIQKVIWWLSVDFFFMTQKTDILNKKRPPIHKRILTYIFNNKKYRTSPKYSPNKNSFKYYQFENNTGIKHFVQSKYAYDFLINKKIKPEDLAYLSDYLGNNFLDKKQDYTGTNRKDQVLYNPKKGIEITKQIKEKLPDVEFIALENMTSKEVQDLLEISKLYIDFGHHPGKDRIPREAAICGCCVITNKEGSAKFFEDVMIKDEYKFENEDLDSICIKIKEVLNDYDNLIQDFAPYRKKILNEKSIFEEEVKEIFC